MTKKNLTKTVGYILGLTLFIICILMFVVTYPAKAGIGGTITYDGNYTVHTFTTNGTFTPYNAMSIEVLVIGGGGSGGAGGGGAGELIYNTSFPIVATPYAITIGVGGVGTSSDNAGNKGQNTTFDSLIATGGGPGAVFGAAAADTGCNGGGGSGVFRGGNPLCASGKKGGWGNTNGDYTRSGGGASNEYAGGNATVNDAGNGANGTLNNITGTPIIYACGGGGSIDARAAGNSGTGGCASGGNGSHTGSAESGDANSGSGGGAGGYNSGFKTGGSGGSGVVIIKYLTVDDPLPVTNSGVLTDMDLNTNYSFGIELGESGNVSWYKDGVLIQENISVTVANLTISWNQSGKKNISVISSINYTWDAYIKFGSAADYIWTPVQDWGFANWTNLSINVIPMEKIGYNLLDPQGDGDGYLWAFPGQFLIDDTIHITFAKYQLSPAKYVGLYTTTASVYDPLTLDVPVYIANTSGDGDAQGAVITWHEGKAYFTFQYGPLGGNYYVYPTWGDNITNVHDNHIYPGGYEGVPWLMGASGGGRYAETGFEAPGKFYWNSTGIIAIGPILCNNDVEPARARVIGYTFYNNTNFTGYTKNNSDYRWNAIDINYTPVVAEFALGSNNTYPFFLISDNESTVEKTTGCYSGNDRVGADHQYHDMTWLVPPGEKGLYGNIQIMLDEDYVDLGGQSVAVALWKNAGGDNFTAQNKYGWTKVGNDIWQNLSFLIPLGANGTIDDRTAVGPNGHIIPINNGSQWFMYYNTGAGRYTLDDFAAISAVSSDAHKWAKISLNNTTISGSFETETIDSGTDQLQVFYANDDENEGNITYDILATNGSTLVSDVFVGQNVSALGLPTTIKMKITLTRPNASAISPEVYNWYITDTGEPHGMITNNETTVSVPGLNITYTWSNPSDSTFSYTKWYYWNGTYIGQQSKTTTSWVRNVTIAEIRNGTSVYAQAIDIYDNVMVAEVPPTNYLLDTYWFNASAIYVGSVTNINMETGNFYINNSWVNPVDADFNLTMFKYVNETVIQNVSAGTEYLNLTWSPHYEQNISAQTVDIGGNINETKMWFNATIPNNVPDQDGIGDKTVIVGNILDFTVTASDLDGDNYTFQTNATAEKPGASINATTGYFYWLPNSTTDIGVYSWAFETVDSFDSSLDCEILNVTVTNEAPVLTGIGDKPITLGQYLNFTVNATDADGHNITYGTNASNGTLNTTSGEYSWLTDSLGTFSWYFNASDGYNGLDSETIIVTVSEGEYMPSTPINCISSTTIDSINVSCGKGSGNLTDEFRFYNVTSGWHNTTDLFWNETGLGEGVERTYWIYAYNTSGLGTLNITYVSETNTTATTPPPADTNTTPSLTSVTNSTCLAHSCVVSFDVNQSNALTMVKYGLNESLLQNTTNQTVNLSRSDNLTGLTNNTKYYYSVFAWNSSNASYNTNSTTQNFTTAEDYVPPETPAAPAITSYTPASLTPTVDVNELATFTATANQSVTWDAWSGATELSENGTYTSATQTWTTTGAKTVIIDCSNANGSCTPIQWDVTVVSDGSGGSGINWDWLSGTISPSGVTLTTNATPNTCSVVGTTYSCGYDFVDGNAYWFNFSKSGYTANNSTIVFNEDHEVFNVTLTVVPAAVTVVTNAATDIRTNGATLNGEVNFSGGGSLTMWFEYGTNGRTYPFKTTTQTTTSNTTFSHELYKSTIMANTQYYYRAVAYYNNIYYHGE